MIICLRHAEDDELVDRQYKYDSHITETGKNKATELAHELYEKYGYPTKICFSPFQRCVETAFALVNELIYIKTKKKANKNPDCCLECYKYKRIQLCYENNLSRHITNFKPEKPTVSPKTLQANIPINETDDAVCQRIKNHVHMMKNNKKERIWCITHASLYKQIANKLHIRTTGHIEFLDYYTYANKHKNNSD